MAWRQAGFRYYPYSLYLQERFGGRVRKVSVDAKFTCPNVDGSVTTGGCNFCDNRSFSPSRRLPRLSVRDQIDEGIRRLRIRYPGCDRFLAYFQPGTNTYAPVDRLGPLYASALDHPLVVGMTVGTRPDCVPDPVLDLLTDIATSRYVALELGLQSRHDRSLSWMNRGHDYASYVDAAERSRGRGLERCVHVILGLPGESHADMMATAEAVVASGVESVKIHNLYAVERTPLADQVRSGEVRLWERDEYISVLVDFIERLPPTMVVERISGEAPSKYLVGPAWCRDKASFLQAVQAEFDRRGTRQGSTWPSRLQG